MRKYTLMSIANIWYHITIRRSYIIYSSMSYIISVFCIFQNKSTHRTWRRASSAWLARLGVGLCTCKAMWVWRKGEWLTVEVIQLVDGHTRHTLKWRSGAAGFDTVILAMTTPDWWPICFILGGWYPSKAINSYGMRPPQLNREKVTTSRYKQTKQLQWRKHTQTIVNVKGASHICPSFNA